MKIVFMNGEPCYVQYIKYYVNQVKDQTSISFLQWQLCNPLFFSVRMV